MGTHKILGGRLQIAVLLPMALSMLALAGCGNTPQAPFGAVMTAELVLSTKGTPTTGSTNSKRYRVSVVDAAGVPMNGLKVNLYGTFTAGEGITLETASGSVAPGQILPLKSSIELNGSGVQDFWVYAPTIKFATVPTPVINSLTSLAGSGNLSDNTYGFAVTALDAASPPGETVRSSSSYISLSTGGTVTNNAIQVTWNSVNGAAGYNLYGCTTAACTPGTLLATVSTGTQYLVQNPTGGGTATKGFGTSGLAVNTVTGVIEVQSGSLSQILDASLP